MTDWPDSPETWRAVTARFGTADWDTGVLYWASVADIEDPGPVGAAAGAAAAGDAVAVAVLGTAGVVALRAGWDMYDVEETVDGWALQPAGGTPDVAGLAMAAVIRATRLAAERRPMP